MTDSTSLRRQAELLYLQNQPIEAGKLLFEAVPLVARPNWAAKALQLALTQGDVQDSLFDKTIASALEPRSWNNGHRVFDALRGEVLKLEKKTKRTLAEETRLSCLYLAELVAKVTYNATNPTDEFDEDSGWWIALSLLAMANNTDQPAYAAKAWDTLCS